MLRNWFPFCWPKALLEGGIFILTLHPSMMAMKSLRARITFKSNLQCEQTLQRQGMKASCQATMAAECFTTEDSVCLPAANKRLWPISDHLIFFSANKSSLPPRWHELFSVATPPNQTQGCMWNEPKANTVKNSKLNQVHELYILPGQHRGILSPLCFGSFVILASALHRKVFIGHEITFMRIKMKF